MFQPLGYLFGTYERVGETAGILINSKHPPSLQRYTAAHEYAHHVLGHMLGIDDEHTIEAQGKQLKDQELAAQVFAAHFLMPLKLVNETLSRFSADTNEPTLTPRLVYLLSLELGVSYSAMVNQLVALHKVDHGSANQLLRETPKRIKEAIGYGVGPAVTRADVWPLERSDNERTLYPRVEDELMVQLPETPSSGYVWTFRESEAISDQAAASTDTTEHASAETAFVSIRADEFTSKVAPGEPQALGGEGTRRFSLRLIKAGLFTLHLEKRRPWQAKADPIERYSLLLSIASRPTGEGDQGLLAEIQVRIAVAA